MYEAIKNAINNTDFDLRVIIEKIDIFFAEDKISREERNELLDLARSKAKPENSYNLQKQVDNLEARVRALENKNVETEDTETSEPADEYPEFVQPTGAHDSYKIGDKVTYNGKKYICKLENCVWSPDTYPQGWEEVVEVTEDNVEV